MFLAFGVPTLPGNDSISLSCEYIDSVCRNKLFKYYEMRLLQAIPEKMEEIYKHISTASKFTSQCKISVYLVYDAKQMN